MDQYKLLISCKTPPAYARLAFTDKDIRESSQIGVSETLLKNLLEAIGDVIGEWNENDITSRIDPDEDALIGTGALQALERAADAVRQEMEERQ